MNILALKAWLTMQSRTITLLSGAFVVGVWTLLRHLTNGVNFDIVGQIGVVAQWSQGLHSGVQLGATNYLLKFPLYYGVNQLHFLTPMHRILLLALICNVLTFVLIFLINEKFLDLYRVKQRRWHYLAMFWLATIAGKVFWVDYANSRNLETVGGLYFIYLMLNFWLTGNKKVVAGAAAIGSVTFFADPLQMFVIIGGFGLYLLGYLVVKKSSASWQRLVTIFGTIAVAVVTAKMIAVVTGSLLRINYMNAPSSRPALTYETAKLAAHGLEINTLKIFDANLFKQPYGLNSVRQVLNALILIMVVAFIVRLVVKRRLRSAVSVGIAAIGANYLVYLASGQVLQWETSRYLIMVPLLLICVFVVQSDEPPRLKGDWPRRLLILQGLWLGCLVISAILLVGALVVNWPQRHSKDAPIYAAVTFMQQHEYKFALASREVGVTTTYFSEGAVRVLPMACTSDHKLQQTNLFYDSSSFASLQSYHGIVPVIVGSEGILYGHFSCSLADIIAQFGEPISEQSVPTIGLALLYDASQVKQKMITGVTSPPQQKKVTPITPPVVQSTTFDSLTTLPPLLNCDHGTTDVIVAHPDDDILFMNPALEQQLLRTCLRTVYLTAADNGQQPAYWQGRERGIEAAYALMMGADNSWMNKIIVINGHQVLERILVGRPSLALVFLRLPDGSVAGDGFAATGHQSLKRLTEHAISKINAIDHTASYSYDALVQTLATVIKIDQPISIYTQLPSGPNSHGDHSDHRAVGLLGELARRAASSSAHLSFYFGYPINTLASNLSVNDSVNKRRIFEAYAKADTEICKTNSRCAIEITYGRYFMRSYKTDMY